MYEHIHIFSQHIHIFCQHIHSSKDVDTVKSEVDMFSSLKLITPASLSPLVSLISISSLPLSMNSLCLLAISLVYVRPLGLAPSLSMLAFSFLLSQQPMIGHQAQLHLSLSLPAISLVYDRPLGLAPSLSSSCQLSLCQAIRLWLTSSQSLVKALRL